MTLFDAKTIADTYNRINAIKTFLNCERSIHQSYTLTEMDKDGFLRTITIKYDQIKTVLKELEKELDILQSALDHSQIVIRPNEIKMEKE